jgi:hypothetical protein
MYFQYILNYFSVATALLIPQTCKYQRVATIAQYEFRTRFRFKSTKHSFFRKTFD